MYKTTIPVVITNRQFNKEKTLAEIRRSGAERIALAIDRELGHAFSTEENLRLLREAIEYFKKHDIETLVWIGETLGHSGGKPCKKSSYANIRYFNKGEIDAYCPADAEFTADFCSWVRKIAKCGADMIMFDDDFRLSYRGGMGCVCDVHMAMIEKELDENITVEELYGRIFDGGKNKYRSAYLKVMRNTMYDFARKIRSAADEINPKLRLGICASPSSWDAEGWDVCEMSGILAGNTKPFVRTIGAPYWACFWDSFRGALNEVFEIERAQTNRLKDSGIEVITEGDTYPRPRTMCPASYLECFDTVMRADGSSDGILKYALDYVSDPDYETGYIDAMVENLGLYKEIEGMFSNKAAVGVRPYNVLHTDEEAYFDVSNPNNSRIFLDNQFFSSLRFTTMNSLPVTYEKGGVNIIFGENARHIPIEDLKYGNIIDYHAARLLCDRGIDVGIAEILQAGEHKAKGFTDIPTERYIKENVNVRLSADINVINIRHKDGAKILTEYRIGDDFVPGVYEYQNSDGLRFLVYPFDARFVGRMTSLFGSYAGRRLVAESMRNFFNSPLPVELLGNYPNLYVMAKEDRDKLVIGLWNTNDDKINELKISVNTNISEALPVGCELEFDENEITLKSTLYPYEFAGVEILKVTSKNS